MTSSGKAPAKPAKKGKSSSATAPAKPAIPSGDTSFPVVGMVASAGGLRAFKQLFNAMPQHSNMAFVLVPHLDPTHDSLMVELLSKYTRIPVLEARHGQVIKANHIYVIPPGYYLGIENGAFQLVEPTEPRGRQIAIDHFLRSLAAAYGEQSIGIVLSGTGAHGTLGLRAIKGVGGLAIVQDPDTAEFDQMPRSAAQTGIADFVLAAEAIPETLLAHMEQVKRSAGQSEHVSARELEYLGKIHQLLRLHTSYDFSCYRKKMLLRRVTRRMDLHHILDLPQYLVLLEENPDELQRLYRDLLIGVTSFFRDPSAFQALVQHALEPLMLQKSPDDVLRVWIAGCATGEEAYSIAMHLIEAQTAMQRPCKLQLFATDIDSEALDFARQGIYPDGIAADVGPQRMRKFFQRVDDNHLQVNKRLRETVVFAQQNLLSDVPFSNLDLISCRNLLIYLEPEAQAKIIRLFHFALKPDGYLMLGTAETAGRHTDLFATASKKWRVFQRVGKARRTMSDFPIVQSNEPQATHVPGIERMTNRHQQLGELVQRKVLEDFAVAAVLLTPKHDVLYYFGPTGKYLEMPSGEPTRNLWMLLRRGLRYRVRAACIKVEKEQAPVTVDNAQVLRDGAYHPVAVTVKRIDDGDGANLLVTFVDRSPGGFVASSHAPGEVLDESPLLQQMEYELKVTRQDLQNTIEELDGNIEELKASNEEAMSVNEELQSSNEELQTSKEELQSLNEELSTVNNQLQDKVEELEEANNDVDNFLRSTNIATLFLDPDLRIKRFTAATTRLFNLLPGDIGRPLTDFSMNFIDPQLGRETRQVIDSLETHERVISDRQGKWYLRRIQPYKTQANHIEGVVVSFVDMTQRIAAEAETRLLATVLSDSNDAIMVVDLGGTIRSWNRGANRLYGYTSEQAVHMNFLDLISEADRPAAAKVLDEVKSGESLDNTELQAITSRGNTVDTLLTATRVVNPHDESCIIAITQHDISQRKQWERQLLEVNRELKEAIGKSKQQLSRSENEFRVLADNVPAQFSYFDTQQRYRYVNKQYGKLWQIPTKDIVDKSIHELLGDDGYRQAKPRIEKALSGEPQEYESQFTIGQKHMIMRVNYVPNVNAQGKVIGVFSLAQDVTELRENEHLQRAQKLRIRAIVDTVSDAILTINEEGVIQDVNTAALHIFDYPADEMLGKFVSSFIVEPKAIEKAPTVTSFVTQWQPDSNAYRYVIGQTRGGRRFPIEGSIREIEHSGIYVIVLRDQSLQRQLEREIIETSTLEQEHIGREIHDGLGQELTAVTMLAVSLQGKLERAHIADFAPDIQRLVEQLQRTLAETRSLSAGLSPIDIGPDGLLDALSTLAERVQSTADIPCHIVASGTVGSLPETTATHLYRIAQEAINNAVKHAKPARIEVQLRNDADNIYLSVSDDGRGLQPKRSGREKLGMHIMRYRASIIGGHLEIASSPGVGTVVRCILPYESINAGESNKV